MRPANKAERAANEALLRLGVKSPPVPVERIAESNGAKLAYRPFQGNISGMLYRRQDGSSPVIGVNSLHAATRQRFTIAHELAHLLLHPGKEMILDEVVRVDYRDDRSSRATDAQEIAANQFAAELLMPTEWIEREVMRRFNQQGLDPGLVGAELASTFLVSEQAMEYRLTNLGLRRHI